MLRLEDDFPGLERRQSADAGQTRNLLRVQPGEEGKSWTALAIRGSTVRLRNRRRTNSASAVAAGVSPSVSTCGGISRRTIFTTSSRSTSWKTRAGR